MLGTSDPYFDWLCIAVGVDKRNPKRSYLNMVTTFHEMEFRPVLPMDANRGADGLQLRVDFMNEHGPWGSAVNRGPCSFFEFLVALCKRMSFLMHGEGNHGQTAYYFWKLIDNLGLKKVSDDRWDYCNGQFFVEDAVWRVNERQYYDNGEGGLFPLRNPTSNQQNVEIWYQMNAWLIENSDVNEW